MKNLSKEDMGLFYSILIFTHPSFFYGLPWWLRGKESTCNAGDPGSIPGSGRSPGGGHGNPLQYCCWENPMDRGAWRAIIHRVVKSHISKNPSLPGWQHGRVSHCKPSGLATNRSTPSFPLVSFSHWCLHLVKVYCCLVTKSCPTLCDSMDCSPPGSSVHEIS